MRKILFTLLFVAMCITAFADDVIALRSGDIINAIVTEVTVNEIKYKKASNPQGPVYSVEKNNVLSIKYANGEIDKFEVSSNNNEATTNEPLKALPDEYNDEQKALYDKLPRLNLKLSNKESNDFFPIMAFTEASVISTKELTIVIVPEAPEYYDGGWRTKVGYTICISNATDAPIYIDRARSFKKNNDADTKCYFDNSQVSVTHGNSAGGGLGIGLGGVGIGIGGASGSSHTQNYGVERFLVIGPKSKANLTDYKIIRLSQNKAEFKIVSDIEYWGFNFINSENKIKQGEVRTYTEAESPYSNSYYITYSTDQEFKNTYILNFELYAKYVVGAKMKESVWSNASAEASLVKEIKKVVPDFWTDCMSIVGLPGQYR